MNSNEQFSVELLNAYIDGELSAEDELELLEAMQKDTSLLKRINELKRMKLLVKNTYLPSAKQPDSFTKYRQLKFSVLASALLSVGIAGGWYSHHYTSVYTVPNSRVSHIDTSLDTVKVKEPWNIVLHVNSNDPYVQKTILDETESLLESFKQSKEKVKVEIVAYGKGVYLFDSKKTQYKQRLKSLKNSFNNLSYAVCGRTVTRLEKNQGRKIKLISKMTVARSGIYQIIKRQKQGWNYIRI